MKATIVKLMLVSVLSATSFFYANAFADVNTAAPTFHWHGHL